jgi:ubiquinone/menaquinone biosynthesis C-methylase UbiE
MNPTEFTRKIWGIFGSTAHKRAVYLWDLYSRHNSSGCAARRCLDIGCGSGQNAIVFGSRCQWVHCLEIGIGSLMKCRATFRAGGVGNVSFYQADAQTLPFISQTFDLVSMFSVIEHVPDQHLAIQEASRVLTEGGELVLQVPNRYFFVDLHTGLPLLHFLPLIARRWFLAKLGYSGLGDAASIRVPSKGELASVLQAEFAKVRVLKVIYPSDLIMTRLRPAYFVLKRLGIFNLVPFGWLFIADKAKSANLCGDAR